MKVLEKYSKGNVVNICFFCIVNWIFLRFFPIPFHYRTVWEIYCL